MSQARPALCERLISSSTHWMPVVKVSFPRILSSSARLASTCESQPDRRQLLRPFRAAAPHCIICIICIISAKPAHLWQASGGSRKALHRTPPRPVLSKLPARAHSAPQYLERSFGRRTAHVYMNGSCPNPDSLSYDVSATWLSARIV